MILSRTKTEKIQWRFPDPEPEIWLLLFGSFTRKRRSRLFIDGLKLMDNGTKIASAATTAKMSTRDIKSTRRLVRCWCPSHTELTKLTLYGDTLTRGAASDLV